MGEMSLPFSTRTEDPTFDILLARVRSASWEITCAAENDSSKI